MLPTAAASGTSERFERAQIDGRFAPEPRLATNSSRENLRQKPSMSSPGRAMQTLSAGEMMILALADCSDVEFVLMDPVAAFDELEHRFHSVH